MSTQQLIAPEAPESYDRDDPVERVYARFVRDAFEMELLGRVEAALDRQLAVFLSIQAVPSRWFREAA